MSFVTDRAYIIHIPFSPGSLPHDRRPVPRARHPHPGHPEALARLRRPETGAAGLQHLPEQRARLPAAAVALVRRRRPAAAGRRTADGRRRRRRGEEPPAGGRVREPSGGDPLGGHDAVRAGRRRRRQGGEVPEELAPIRRVLLQVHQEPLQAVGQGKGNLPGIQTPGPSEDFFYVAISHLHLLCDTSFLLCLTR